jgi:transcriptional regulator with XRE-family HTH domain
MADSRPGMLEPRQCRAARALLGWSRARLATESGIPVPTLERYERGETSPYLRTVAKLRRTLERAGVAFIDPAADHGAGVMLKEGQSQD